MYANAVVAFYVDSCTAMAWEAGSLRLEKS